MNEPLGYSRDGDVVTLRMTADDYQKLVLAMGWGAGAAVNPLAGLALANRLLAGCPDFMRYGVPDV